MRPQPRSVRRDETPVGFNTTMPRYLRDKIKSAAVHTGMNQNELFLDLVEERIKRMEAERGEPFPYLPSPKDVAERRDPSF